MKEEKKEGRQIKLAGASLPLSPGHFLVRWQKKLKLFRYERIKVFFPYPVTQTSFHQKNEMAEYKMGIKATEGNESMMNRHSNSTLIKAVGQNEI